jgi:hypothetical protein
LNIIQYATKILNFFQIPVFSLSVSKPRSPGQTLIAVALDKNFLEEIDRKRGTMNRSQFIRESLARHLGVSLVHAAAPDRTAKGGRPKKYSSEDAPKTGSVFD